jgi:hypothetical protein
MDTLEVLLKGHREKFKGLWIDESDYNWKLEAATGLSPENELYGHQ